MNDFNYIAPFYDALGRIVFGNALIKSQSYHLQGIQPNSEILIVGGGSGRILTEFDKLSIPLSVTYVEKSSKMVELSKNKGPFKNLSVHFVCGECKDITVKNFDVIFTAFFLDVFRSANLHWVIQCLKTLLGPDGIWIVTDFIRTPTLWQRLLIRSMYAFFRITAGLEGNKLLDFEKYLIEKDLNKGRCKTFYKGMIESAIYYK